MSRCTLYPAIYQFVSPFSEFPLYSRLLPVVFFELFPFFISRVPQSIFFLFLPLTSPFLLFLLSPVVCFHSGHISFSSWQNFLDLSLFSWSDFPSFLLISWETYLPH